MDLVTLCMLCYLVPVTVAQATLLQSPALQSVSVGSTVRMNCHTSWYASVSVHWYKQMVRGNLRSVHIVSKYSTPTGRFSGEVNDKSTVYTLVIHNVQRNDSGVYFCAGRKSYPDHFIFGNGSHLLITGTPNVILLSPPLQEMVSMETLPLLCLVSNVIANNVPIDWNISTWDAEGWTGSVAMDSTGVYSIRSHIRVPAEAWKYGAVCTCSVQISSTAIPNSESISYQKALPSSESQHIACSLMFYGSTLPLISLVMILIVVGGCIYGNCCSAIHFFNKLAIYFTSGNWNTDKESADFQTRDSNQEDPFV
ncbi:immunoglobulin gamma-1 heavy chain-like [Stegostoma tigrinum]|uniref:immunoglobulin gamma-1 heavy chain-like n=1 Tax=Stegostoma tigrinum TaxID=3053191 RepID=UPI00287007A7|nr:immunoglobulin gamma-1 heavy chain-like [Stegostoma tigrinum]